MSRDNKTQTEPLTEPLTEGTSLTMEEDITDETMASGTDGSLEDDGK